MLNNLELDLKVMNIERPGSLKELTFKIYHFDKTFPNKIGILLPEDDQ
jgi:hypothetical protein